MAYLVLFHSVGMGRFILGFLFIFGFQAKASSVMSCSSLFARYNTHNTHSTSGALFLHQKNQNIHTSRPVKITTQRNFLKTGERLQKPEHKVDAWLKYLEQVSIRASKDPSVLLRLKGAYYKLYVIKPNEIPQSYYDLQVRIIRERGYGNIEITPQMKAQASETLIKDQKKSLDDWIEYLVSPDSSSYPMWAKYWAFQGIVKLSQFNKETQSFGNRDKTTVAPFVELNREAFALVIDAVVKKLNKESLDEIQDPQFLKLLDGLNFGKLYARALMLSKTGTPGSQLQITKGRWVTYPQGSDHMPLVKSLEGKNTGWCTAGESTAKSQLSTGDFHVYYSLDQFGKPTIPRVAIRMEDSKIAEVRGIGKNQNLDENITSSSIVTDKLKTFGSEGNKYTKKSNDMAHLTSIDHKSKQGLELSKEDLIFLYEINNKIEGFGYQKDPRIEEIIQNRNTKKDIAFIFDVLENQVSLSNSPKEEFFSQKIKVHYGRLIFPELKHVENLTLPSLIIGDIHFPNLVSIRNFKFPKYFHGNIYLRKLTTAEGLRLPNTIHGDVYMPELTSGKGVEFPNIIYGRLDLDRIESPKDLRLPRIITGQLGLVGLKSSDHLILPDEIGSVNLTGLSSIKGIRFPHTINSLYLSHLKYTPELELPLVINNELRIEGITFDEYNKIRKKPEVKGAIYLRHKLIGTPHFTPLEL